MKYIHKSSEPKSLFTLRNLRSEKFNPSFDKLPPNVYYDIIASLLRDQGFLCCYTMNEISPETAELVHFHPRTYFKEEELDFRNMFLAYKYPDMVTGEQRIGQASKGDALIPNYISDKRCASYFRYNTLGEILPAGTFRTLKKCRDNFRKMTPEQQTVLSTIEVLNLNADRLKEQRKAILTQIAALARKYGKSQIQEIAHKLKKRDANGKFKRFCEVMIYYLENVA